MRLAAVAAIVLVVAYCARLALAGEPPLDAELADARFVVAPPVTASVVPAATGDVPPVASTAPAEASRVDGPAAAVRVSNARQVTPTVAPPALLVIPHYDEWVALARCESGGNWAINTSNSYFGGLQFSLTSWKGAGGLQYAARPDLASAAEQMLTAEILLSMQGWRAWPVCSRRVGLL